jgi:hypothetical protein
MENMTHMLLTNDIPDILIRTQLALDDANEAANNICVQIIGLRKTLEFVPMDSKAGSIQSLQ